MNGVIKCNKLAVHWVNGVIKCNKLGVRFKLTMDMIFLVYTNT